MADEHLLEYGDLIFDDGTFEELSANIKKSKAELLDLAKATKKAFKDVSPQDIDGMEKREKAIKEVEVAQKALIKTEKALQVAKKKTIQLTNEELIELQKNKAAQRERIAIAKQQAIIQNKASGQIEKLRANLALTTLQWKKITAEEKKNNKVLNKAGDTAKSVIKRKKELTDQLKKLEKQTGDTRREVGNYGKALGKTGKIAARVFIGRSIVDGLRSISNGVVDLIANNRDADESINELGNAFDSTGNSLKNAALSLLKLFVPALIAVADGVKFLSDLFTGASVGAREFTATSGELAEKTKLLGAEFAKESAELAIVFSRLGETTKGTKEHKEVIDQINTAYGKYLPNLLTEESTLRDIAQAQNLVNQALTQQFLLKVKQATLEDVVTNKVKNQIESFKALNQASGDALVGNVAQYSQLIQNLNDTDSAASRAFKSIEGNVFAFDRLNEKVAESDPALAKFLESIKNLSPGIRGVLTDGIEKAARRSSDYNDVISETNSAISDIAGTMATYDHSVTSSTKSLKDNTAAQIANSEARLSAIEAVEKQLEAAEIGNIEDKQERLLELEESRFKEEQKLKELQFSKDSILLEGHEEELLQLQRANDRLGEQQEVDHQNKLAEIKAQFNKQEIDIVSIDVQKDAIEKEAELLNEKVANVEESNEKIKKSNDGVLKGIQKSAQKIGAIIVDLYKKQADLSKDNVDEQQGNLSRARDRAEKGLKANLAFEENELSKRQLEQQRRQKEAEQAARILTLFNLVSAYAAGGDKNALARGLVDFALLTALSAGFEEGGFTGNGGVSDIAGVVHGKEFVVTASDTERFGLTGKSGSDFGEAMSDYYSAPSLSQINPYQEQRESFSRNVKPTAMSDKRIVDKLDNIEKQLKAQPNYSAQIVEVQHGLYEFVLRTQKQNMTTIDKKILRAAKKNK